MSAIHLLVRINASVAKTFSALTTNENIAAWFTETKCNEWVVGSKVCWFDSTNMTIMEFTKNKSLDLHVHEGGGWDNTQIGFEVVQDGDKTLVRFDHTGWGEISDHFRDCSMSWAYFLESLKLYLETGTGTPEGVAPACESPG